MLVAGELTTNVIHAFADQNVHANFAEDMSSELRQSKWQIQTRSHGGLLEKGASIWEKSFSQIVHV